MLQFDVHKTLGEMRLHLVGEAGEGVTALVGASGAGKTSLLNMIAGLLKPDQGHITLNGIDLSSLPPHQRQIGYVFQEQLLFPHMNVERNLRYGGDVEFASVVKFLGLSPLLLRRPATLSGGEKQRVALARALLSAPRLLLLDEPLANLDQARKDEILPYLEKLQSQFGIPTLFVSHQADEVRRLAKHILQIENGAIKPLPRS